MYDSMDLSGNLAIVGAHGGDLDTPKNGAAYVYTRSKLAEMFTFKAELAPEDHRPTVHDHFGYSVAAVTKTRTVVVSALGADPKTTFDKTVDGQQQSLGAAYVFVENGIGGWAQQAKLVPSDGLAGDLFGHSVSADQDTVVVSADSSAYVYRRNTDGTWKQEAKLRLKKAAKGNGVYVPHVSVSGDTVAVGAHWQKGGGAVFIFERSLKRGRTPAWTQKHKLSAADVSVDAFFGGHISLQEGLLAVSAHGHKDEAFSGAIFIFELGKLSKKWTQVDQLRAKDPFGT